MTKYTKAQQAEMNEAKAELHRLITPGQVIYTKCSHVSRSGMMRHIQVYAVTDKNYDNKADIRNITHLVAKLCGYKTTEYGHLKVGGGGMDMGFSVVYGLGCAMYGRGEEAQKYNIVTRRNGNTEPDTDGGYLLSQRWL